MNHETDRKESEIITRVLQGDTEAFSVLVTRYTSPVYRLAFSLCREQYLAQEATQEAFIEAFLHLQTLADREKFGAWIFSIARRKCFRLTGRRRYDTDISDVAESLYATEDGPYEHYLAYEKRDRVRSAVSGLPEKMRETAERYYLTGLSIREISDSLGIPEGSVKRRLHDARMKLRKDLYDMEDQNRTGRDSTLIATIEERLAQLSHYYSMHGKTYDGFDLIYEETETMIDRIPDEGQKQHMLASLLLTKFYRTGRKDPDLIGETRSAAEKGSNAEVLCHLLIEEYLDLPQKKELPFLNETALPQIEAFAGTPEGDTAKGILLFWRGRSFFKQGDTEHALADFREAIKRIDQKDVYYANAIAAEKGILELQEHGYSQEDGFAAMGETIAYDNSRCLFVSQPGFSSETDALYTRHRFDALFYFASLCRRTLFDTSMKPEEPLYDPDEQNPKNKLTLICTDAEVTVPAGRFKGCMQMRLEVDDKWIGPYTVDTFYAAGVGMVRCAVVSSTGNETYDLKSYEIKGGAGYLPFAVGNTWSYYNPDLPAWIYQKHERTIEYTDGKLANFSVTNIVTLQKDSDSLQKDIDSESCVNIADIYCSKWQIADALKYLRAAVRANTSERAVNIALCGIDALSRQEKYQKRGYRFLPSSVSGSRLSVKDRTVRFDEGIFYHFGPYRLGKRGRPEDRIFGIKPFRFQNQLFGCVFSPNWEVGYTEERVFPDSDIPFTAKLTVSDGGTVSTPAGSFENCLLVTIEAELPEDQRQNASYYFEKGYRYMHCGTKRYWYAKGIGIVRMVCDWGETCHSEAVLRRYSLPAASEEEYMPVAIGNEWEYEIPALVAEGYIAKRYEKVTSGLNGEFLLASVQEFIYLGTEEAYEAMRASEKAKK